MAKAISPIRADRSSTASREKDELIVADLDLDKIEKSGTPGSFSATEGRSYMARWYKDEKN